MNVYASLFVACLCCAELPAAAEGAFPFDETILLGVEYVWAGVYPETCLTSSEARRGVLYGSAPIIGGAVAGAAVGTAFGKTGKWAKRGAFLGGLVSVATRKSAEVVGRASQSLKREIEHTICEINDRAEKQREPLLIELVDNLGARCDISMTDFAGVADVASSRLRQCAKTDPDVLSQGNLILQTIWEINHSACVSATLAVRQINDRHAREAAANGQSYIQTISELDCDTRARVQAAWAPLFP